MRGLKWCDICRDEEVDLRCKADDCRKAFHVDCLRNSNLLYEDDDLSNYRCPDCRQAEDNDSFCYKCQKEDDNMMLLCDSCPRSAHLECLNLVDVPDTDEWHCPVCNPNYYKEQAKKAACVRSHVTGKTKLGNADVCYVCQKTGKLLGCDYCEQSFHPTCLHQDYVNVFTAEDWQCPLCLGVDPLKNMGHKRLSKSARQKMSQERQKNVKRERTRCSANRDLFLWQSRLSLKTFISPKTFARIKKNAQTANAVSRSAESRTSRLKRVKSEDDISDTRDAKADKISTMVIKQLDARARRQGFCLLHEGVMLKPYQEYGVAWLLNAFDHKAGAILADEMGLGKTIQTLAFLSGLKSRSVTGPHLIVVPLSTVGNWVRELRTFTPHMTFTKICGSKSEREHAINDPVASDGCYDVYITTYETCVNEEWFFTDNFLWQCMVLDEAHRIKNEAGRVRHSLDRINVNMRILLTGTPLQNSSRELFTLLNFLFPDVLRDSEQFELAFQIGGNVQKNAKTGKASTAVDTVIDEKRISKIVQLLSKLMLRRTKDLVVSLPRKINHQMWIPMSPLCVKWYNTLMRLSELDLENANIRKLLGTVIKMRICCSHPRGMIAREQQSSRLVAMVEALDDEKEIAEIKNDIEKLKEAQGFELVTMSSKLMFVDKLLTALHRENMDYVEEYRADFNYHRQEALRQYVRKNRKTILDVNGCTAEIIEPTIKSLDDLDPEEARVSPAEPDTFKKFMYPAKNLSVPFMERQKTTTESETAAEDMPKRERHKSRTARSRMNVVSDSEDDEDETPLNRVTSKIDEFARSSTPPGSSLSAAQTKRSDLDAFAADETMAFEERVRAKSEQEEDVSPEKEEGAPDKETADKEEEEEEKDHPDKSEDKVESEKKVEFEDKRETLGTEEESSKEEKPLCHKVLIFTQFTLILDELERYCQWRGFRYMRLDGSTNKMIRELDIREFNSLESTHLVYLICTRAGGVGINLVTANHVVMYDEDWNPFVDMQAIDRSHRIGQTRDVNIWKLTTEWSVEERMTFRREQKLKMDKVLIQASREDAEHLLDEDAEVEEKMNADEVKKLIRHGAMTVKYLLKQLIVAHILEGEAGQKEAIVKHYGQEIFDCDQKHMRSWKLEDFVKRERKEIPKGLESLPDLDELMASVSATAESSDTENAIDLKEVLGSEDEESPKKVPGNQLESEPSSPSASTSLPSETIVSEKAEELKARESTVSETTSDVGDAPIGLRRTTRVRRQPKSIYSPTLWHKDKVERIVTHERRCFTCFMGLKPPQGEEKSDSLVPCYACPKVYHRDKCLGLEKDPPKTWRCPWHECCLCFRRGSQAGGLLIHCAECPTAFCFDCFPPEYTRFSPGYTFFDDLASRGFSIRPDKFITFLCSRCKALKEQNRRRQLTQHALEEELREQREKQKQLKEDAQRLRENDQEERDRTQKERQLQKKRRIEEAERKKKAEELEKDLEEELRKAYQRLFPVAFVDAITTKRQQQVETFERSRTENAESAAETLESGATEGEATAAPRSPIAAAKTGRRGPAVFLARYPKETLRLCDNCRLPSHDTGSCPFPQEVVRIKCLPTTPYVEISEAGTVSLPDGGVVPQNARVQDRGFCSRCGVPTRLHTRKQCPKLTDAERATYAHRRELGQRLIHEVKNLESISLPTDFKESTKEDIVQALDDLRRVLTQQADAQLKKAMSNCGLEMCISSARSVGSVTAQSEAPRKRKPPTTPSVKGATKRPKSTGVETDVITITSSSNSTPDSVNTEARRPATSPVAGIQKATLPLSASDKRFGGSANYAQSSINRFFAEPRASPALVDPRGVQHVKLAGISPHVGNHVAVGPAVEKDYGIHRSIENDLDQNLDVLLRSIDGGQCTPGEIEEAIRRGISNARGSLEKDRLVEAARMLKVILDARVGRAFIPRADGFAHDFAGNHVAAHPPVPPSSAPSSSAPPVKMPTPNQTTEDDSDVEVLN